MVLRTDAVETSLLAHVLDTLGLDAFDIVGMGDILLVHGYDIVRLR
eukprot:SAG22_NODE_3953_length_1459_cov_2.036216_2_plen_46_part_00